MPNIYTLTKNGFFASFSTVQYRISRKLNSESTTLDLQKPTRYAFFFQVIFQIFVVLIHELDTHGKTRSNF